MVKYLAWWLPALVALAPPSTSVQVPLQENFREEYHLSGLGVVGREIAGEVSCEPNASGMREVRLLKSIDGPAAATLEWRPGAGGSCEAFLVRDAERQRLHRGWDTPEVAYEAMGLAYYEHLSGFVRVFERTVPPGLWVRVLDIPGGRIRPWSELLTSSRHTFLGYDGQRLHERPSADSPTMVTLRERTIHDSRVHELVPTGEMSGGWGKFEVIEFNGDFYLLTRSPDTAPTGNAWQGWMRLVDGSGSPQFWFFTRD